MKKIFVLVSALTLILVSCSNPSDSVSGISDTSNPTSTDQPAEEESVVLDYLLTNNKVTPIDFNVDLTNYEETVPDEEAKCNYIYITKYVWDNVYARRNVDDNQDYRYKPVLKVESNKNGFVFCYVEDQRTTWFTMEEAQENNLQILEDECAYKCILYRKPVRKYRYDATQYSTLWYYKTKKTLSNGYKYDGRTKYANFKKDKEQIELAKKFAW